MEPGSASEHKANGRLPIHLHRIDIPNVWQLGQLICAVVVLGGKIYDFSH